MIPSWRLRLLDRDRRHRGGGAAPRVRPHRARAPAVGAHRTAHRTAARAPGAAAGLVGMGLDEAMPLPFLAPGELTRCRAPRRAASPSSTRWSPTSPCCARRCSPGCCRPSPTTPPTATRCRPVRDRPRLPASRRPSQLLPDERECLACHRAPASMPRAPWPRWQVVGRRPRASPTPPWSTPRSPACTPPARADIVVAGEAVGEVGEIDPEVLAATASASASPGSQVDLTRLLALPHGERPYRLVSRFPSSDIDLAFDVADPVPATAVEATVRDGGRRPARLAPACSTCTAARRCGEGRRSLAYSPAAPGPRPHPHRRRGAGRAPGRHRRGRAGATTPSSAEPSHFVSVDGCWATIHGHEASDLRRGSRAAAR